VKKEKKSKKRIFVAIVIFVAGIVVNKIFFKEAQVLTAKEEFIFLAFAFAAVVTLCKGDKKFLCFLQRFLQSVRSSNRWKMAKYYHGLIKINQAMASQKRH